MQPPVHQKPDAPGIWMNFDNTVSLYHVVGEEDGFERAAHDLFALVQEAQERFPGWPRLLFLDIRGHLDTLGRFEDAFVELQQEFMFGFLGPFLTAVDLPLVSALNPEPQRNDLPDKIVVAEEGAERGEEKKGRRGET